MPAKASVKPAAAEERLPPQRNPQLPNAPPARAASTNASSASKPASARPRDCRRRSPRLPPGCRKSRGSKAIRKTFRPRSAPCPYSSIGDLLTAACKQFAGQPCLHLHGQGHHLRRGRAAIGGLRRLSAIERLAERRARCADDAERAAVSGGDDGHPSRRLCRGERQSALHAARTRAPAQGFRRAGHRHSRKFCQHLAGGDRQDRGQACRRRSDGRHAWRPERNDRQPRRAPREEDGAGVVAARPRQVQRGA